MEYQDAVAEARTLVKRSEDDQWRLAQLTFEQIDAGKSQRQWAQDVGLSRAHVQRLQEIWKRHGPTRATTGISFTEALYEIQGGTTEERTSRRALADPEAVRQAVAENPEVRKAIVEDPQTYQKLSQARVDHVVEQADRGDITREEFSEGMRRAYDESALLQLSKVQERLGSLIARFQPADFAEEVTSEREADGLVKSLTYDIDFLMAVREAVQTARTPRLVSRSS